MIKKNIQCTIKFKNFNKVLKLRNRNRWLILSKSVGCSFINDDFNSFSLIFSHLELYSWFIDLFLYCFYIIKVKELKSSCIKLQLALLLRISHLFLLRNLLKKFNLIVHWILRRSLICFTFDMFYILRRSLIMM